MGLFNSLFGGFGNPLVTALLALGIVVVLIVLGLWALKVLFNATGNVGRGRNRRLHIIDSAAIDQKRQLVLVRRDDVEHLVIVGGPQDIVVETGITPPPDPVAAKRPRRRVVPLPDSIRPFGNAEPKTPRPQREAQPARPEPAAQTSAPEPDIPTPTAAIETPADESGSAPLRRPPSLRHTGLLRPAARVEPAVDAQSSTAESGEPEAGVRDSAKTAPKAANSGRREPVIGEADKTSGGDESTDERDQSSKTRATT